MAQYFEVLSQSDGNLEQTHQFFSGSQENERTQVRYILADESPQFQTQQLILSGDQVMVLDGTQQQIQGVVIDQGHTYTTAPQQFGTLVQNATMSNQSAQQIFYMDTSNSENVQTVQTVIEQSSQPQVQTQPIVLNHQISTSPNLTTRQVHQGVQRPVLPIRTPRPGHPQPTRTISSPVRQGLAPQQRPQQPPPNNNVMRPMNPQQPQMRLRNASPQIRLQIQQQQQLQQASRQAQLSQQAKNQLASLNRQKQQLQQQRPQIVQQNQQVVQQQTQPVIQQTQQMVQQQQVPQQAVPQQQSGVLMANQIQKGLSEYQQHRQQQQPIKNQEDELDDHDPAMNSTPSGQMASYKKLLEQRQIGKNSILARLPSNIKVTSTPQQQQTQTPPNTIPQAVEQLVNQANQQLQQINTPPPQNTNMGPGGQQSTPTGVVQKRPRAPARPRNPSAVIRGPAGGTPRPLKVNLRMPLGPRQFNSIGNSGRMTVPPQPPAGPRFAINQQQQQQQRFDNHQQPMMHQQQQRPQYQPPLQQQNIPPQQSPQQPLPVQQNGVSSTVQTPRSNQSQMKYLITPPTPNRPRQQNPLPSCIPPSQLQQIIGMFKESTPIAEEVSDSIRMLVLLENGEQRLITFTLPKEACTIQEILEQVSVPFTPETNIQVTEANTNGINYIVTVGNVANIAHGNNEEDRQEATAESEQQQQQQMAALQNSRTPQFPQQKLQSVTPTPPPAQAESPPKAHSPELPKLISGKLAVCSNCGYTGEDFNKCTRCLRKLPENVRSIEAPLKIDLPKNDNSLMKQLPIKANINQSPLKTDGPVKANSPKKKIVKQKAVENEAVVISSDEEEDDKKPARMVSEQLLHKLGASISISPVTKEPSLNEIKKHVRKLSTEQTKFYRLSLKCRTVRIGSYRFAPSDDVILDSKCIIIKAPVIDNKNEIKTLRIDRGDLVKVLICYNKALPVIFYYLNVGAAPIIRDMLNLNRETGLYFDPVDEKEDSYRKITLLPDDLYEEQKPVFHQLYGFAPVNILEEITAKEANDILIKACPKDTSSSPTMESFSEIKQILMYPKEGRGRLSINTEDYVCLAMDHFLNDKIIDFYLKYLWENLPPELQEKVHVFSTFFYKRLTTKATKAAKKSHPYESDTNLTAAEKRHSRVKNWTKKINLFEKDFIIVPINENAHWFLAIICFPGLKGPQTFDGKPYILPEPKPRKNKKKDDVKKEKPIPCDEPILSDKDEADSEDSDMESDDSEESIASAIAAAAVAPPSAPSSSSVIPSPPSSQNRSKNVSRVPIKQPCILIFDSLAGPSRNRVVATLRDYLTCEYKTKMEVERVFNKEVIKGSCCKVPQQNNFTDCGLYVLQYVEQFFKEPITDYNIPIKEINNWFEEIVVTKKREDICNLIKELMTESGADCKMLPEIDLPTLNGKLIEMPRFDHDHDNAEEEQEDMFTDIEDSEMTDSQSLNLSKISEDGTAKSEDGQEEMASDEENSDNFKSSPIKPSDNSIGEKSEIVTTTVTPSAGIKPTLSEFPTRQTTDKDTLNYLKSKRINRHKTANEGPDIKKTKIDNM